MKLILYVWQWTTIGGIFNIKKPDGTNDNEQIDALLGFNLAVAEINANSNSYNFTLLASNVSGHYGLYGGVKAAEALSTASLIGVYGNTGVDVIINAGDNDICQGSNSILVQKRIPTILLKADDQQFGNGELYPFKAQLNPAETFYGMVFQDIMVRLFI